jgi:hypothetical protein
MPQRAEIVLSDEEREVLERWEHRPTSAQALALRCRLALAAADGVDQPRRAVVRRADDEVAQALSPPPGRRPRRLDPNLDHELERGPEALRLAQDGGRDPRRPRLLLPADL